MASKFKYNDYEEDKTVTGYGDKATSYEKSMDGALKMLQQGTGYSTDMKDALNKVLNRQPFEYDVTGDALYNQYKNQYTALGKQAMKDTVAQAADLTGGYGNSYGVTAGNQAYQGYLNQLNQMVPELYQIALDRYNNETQQLMNNYSLIADADANEYARLQDNLANQQAMASYYGSRRDALAAEDYNRYSDNWNRAYQQQRDVVSDTISTQESAKNDVYAAVQSGIMPSDAMLKAAGLEGSKSQLLAMANVYKKQLEFSSGSSGGGGGSTSGDSSGGSDNGGGSGTGSNYYGLTEDESGSDELTADDYADWSAMDWNSYFAQIRQSDGQAAAEKELSEFSSKGIIPKSMISYAATGARGGRLGH